jgi:hypothetical protein
VADVAGFYLEAEGGPVICFVPRGGWSGEGRDPLAFDERLRAAGLMGYVRPRSPGEPYDADGVIVGEFNPPLDFRLGQFTLILWFGESRRRLALGPPGSAA